jgi:dimethylhistidine N-methyltransferase
MKPDKKGQLHNFEPRLEQFGKEVLKGLVGTPKRIPCKYFYDERGSQLFELICATEEYYIPVIEMTVMQDNIDEMTAVLGTDVLLIEYGSGNSKKTRLLLSHLDKLAAYVPVDISHQHLLKTAENLRIDYPQMEVLPVCADYTGEFDLPRVRRCRHRVVYFPGSTIGNFAPHEARRFLKHIAAVVDEDGGLLIGIDLKKDAAILNRAYNDAEGLTAVFNLNLLERINRELEADFKHQHFTHRAFYNETKGRVEMHLVSLIEQKVRLNGSIISFKQDESIWTESSYKYSLEEFAQLSAEAGFETRCVWVDNNKWFSIQYLVNKRDSL